LFLQAHIITEQETPKQNSVTRIRVSNFSCQKYSYQRPQLESVSQYQIVAPSPLASRSAPEA
jgi:hypothetical protein